MSHSPPKSSAPTEIVTEVHGQCAYDVSPRQNPRHRFTSLPTPASRRISPRKRAITINGGTLSAPLSQGPNKDPSLLELISGQLFGVGNVLDQFTQFQRDVQSFCNKTADHLSRYKEAPRASPASPGAIVSKSSSITKPASDFPSVQGFIYFVLLSIVNTRLYCDIFLPFHPCASVNENRQREDEYRAVVDKDLQPQAAAWRAKNYSSINERVEDGVLAAYLKGISGVIVNELIAALQELPGELPLSKEFSRELVALLHRAYEWNRLIKVEVRNYDFEVFVVEPSSSWEPVQMEPFERLKRSVSSGARVVSSVALGIIGSVSLEGALVSRVQRKALVLVDEWFGGNARGRTISTVHPTYNPPRHQVAASYPPKPISPLPPLCASTAPAQPSVASQNSPPTSPVAQPDPSEIFSTFYASKTPASLPITGICSLIQGLSSIARSTPVSELVWYKERTTPKHEFLLAKIAYPKPDKPRSSDPDETLVIWIRLDRRAARADSDMKSSSCVFPAEDTAVVCSSRETLEDISGTQMAEIQATTEFGSPPSLADLGRLLSAFLEVSPRYNLVNENCFFFCSVIQQILQEKHRGVVNGVLSHEKVNPGARQRIRTALDRQHGAGAGPDTGQNRPNPRPSRTSGNRPRRRRGWLTMMKDFVTAFW